MHYTKDISGDCSSIAWFTYARFITCCRWLGLNIWTHGIKWRPLTLHCHKCVYTPPFHYIQHTQLTCVSISFLQSILCSNLRLNANDFVTCLHTSRMSNLTWDWLFFFKSMRLFVCPLPTVGWRKPVAFASSCLCCQIKAASWFWGLTFPEASAGGKCLGPGSKQSACRSTYCLCQHIILHLKEIVRTRKNNGSEQSFLVLINSPDI